MKILPKGLTLVGIPLIFGIIFIWSLFCGISEANRLVKSELTAKDSIISFVTAARCSVCAVRYMAVYKSTNDAQWLKRANLNDKLTGTATLHLDALHKSDPSLPIPSLEMGKTQLLPEGSGFAKHLAELGKLVLGENQFNLGRIGDITQPLQLICDTRAQDALNATWSLSGLLYTGIFAELVISIALTAFFCMSITNGLKKILNNTISLSKGLELTPPLKGGDEISELDRFFFQAAKQLMELERFKSEMIGVVGHELKNPLNQIQTFLESLRDGAYGKLSAKAVEKITSCCTSVQRLVALIGDLFLLDRSELRINLQTVQIDELLRASVETVRELADQAGVRIVVKSSGGTVVADRDRLIQVMVNLVSNALKFSPQNGQITLDATTNGGWLEFRVTDQGPGIPETLRKQIFEPFTQVDEKNPIAKKGTGLGLTISRTIVEQHGGTIAVDSREGEGSTFWFKVPTAGPAASKPGAASVGTELKNIKIPPMKFSVLKQGLLIISVPLIFQLVFVTMLGGMLGQINKHTELEEASQKLLIAVNQSGDDLLEATRYAMVYMYTKTPVYFQLFQGQLDKATKEIDEGKQQVAGEPAQLKELDLCREAYARFPARVQKEADRLGQEYAHNPKGCFASMNEFVDLIRDPDHPSQTLLNKIQVLIKDKTHLEAYEPFFDAQDAMERLVQRENSTGAKLVNQRERLLFGLNLMLLAGIGLVSMLSILLANFLMINLIRRVNHVMENTSRIIRHEPLEPPEADADEIVYLDKILCETGNRLIALEQFKYSLISIVSHEIRTPLTSVCIMLELLSTGVLGDLPSAGTEQLKVVEEEARELVRLINDLLDLEKMAAGKFVLDKIEIKVGDLVEQTTSAVIPLAELRRMTLKLECSCPDVTMVADRDRMRHALTNLLSSRVKYSPEQSTVEFQTSCKSSTVEFRVIDQAGGIPENLRETIFDRFVQAENPEARALIGPGLTLAIIKAIVEQHGGEIGVDSQMGVGSTFWIKLPLGAYVHEDGILDTVKVAR